MKLDCAALKTHTSLYFVPLSPIFPSSTCGEPMYGPLNLYSPASPVIGVGRRRAPSSPFRAAQDLGPSRAGALKRTHAAI